MLTTYRTLRRIWNKQESLLLNFWRKSQMHSMEFRKLFCVELLVGWRTLEPCLTLTMKGKISLIKLLNGLAKWTMRRRAMMSPSQILCQLRNQMSRSRRLTRKNLCGQRGLIQAGKGERLERGMEEVVLLSFSDWEEQRAGVECQKRLGQKMAQGGRRRGVYQLRIGRGTGRRGTVEKMGIEGRKKMVGKPEKSGRSGSGEGVPLQALRRALNREYSDDDDQEEGRAGGGRSGWADVYDSSSDDDLDEKQKSAHVPKEAGRAKREPVVLVEAPRSERTMVLQRGERELESKNLYRGYVSSAHNVTSFVTGTKRARQVRNQAELENLARAIDLLVSQFGKRVISKVDAVEVILRRMSCVYLADQQESWAMARHLEENPSSLPIPPKMMMEARKAAKLMNPRLMITTANFQPRGDFRDQGSYQGRNDRSQGRERERMRDVDRRRGNEWERGREERSVSQRERSGSSREQPRSRPRP